MEEVNHFLTFSLHNLIFAVPLNFVERVFRSVEITEQPLAAKHIKGVINIHGKVVQVFNIRKLLNLPEKDLSIYDQFILGKGKKPICLWVDTVHDVIQRTKVQISESEIITSEKDILNGMMNFKQGVIFFIEPNCFFQ
ncbi:chemotaxis protein CheW [Pigmentibacter ruber]|uniref:chemotaxis protein CheW n=1 Tax=Pigmentibacter ruber TaxID=2683196 RepID=UPI00131EA40B|nr:chemotaxis protein CheW [Pigmentibacter ruber]